VAELHGRDLPEPTTRLVWWQAPERPTVVLGSTQPDAVVDRERAAAAGVDVVRRRSGGGAVWLGGGDVTWVDVVVPAGDPLWDDDVGGAAHWLGDVWSRALAPWLTDPGAGGGSVSVHRAGLVRTEWSQLVCFAGRGPGEVTVDGAKVVGVSQRRTRSGARFQCAVLHRWDPAPLLDVLALDDGDRRRAAADLAAAGRGLGPVAPATVVAALEAVLPR
jgi:lipoate-protein ligase A